MNKMKKAGKTAAALIVTIVFAAGVPVFALEGTTSTTEGEATKPTTASERKQAAEQRKVAAEERSDNVKEKIAERTDKKSEQKKKICEARKKGLTRKFSNIVANSKKTQTRIDGIYAKSLAYQTAENLQPVDFATLTEAADSAKATSTASIAALQAVTPTVDCNNVSVASDVATFKTAAQKTRDDLKAYRTAVKAVLKSLKEVKPNAEAAEGSTAQ